MILVYLFKQNKFKHYRYNFHFAKVKSTSQKDFLFPKKKQTDILLFIKYRDI